MEGILSFFSDLLVFTGGLVALVFWLVVIILLAVEFYDWVTGADKKKDEVR